MELRVTLPVPPCRASRHWVGDLVQCWPVECGQNVHLARGLIFASVLKVFEGVGAIWEGPDGAPPGSQGGPRPPPQNTTISLRQGAFGV